MILRIKQYCWCPLIFIVLGSLTIGQIAFGSTTCGPFRFPSFQTQDFERHFLYPHRNAILRLELKGEAGTGFLIDSERGLVVTARHVVKFAVKDHDLTIDGFSKMFPNETLKLRVVDATTPSIDVAVLQTVPPNKLSAAPSVQFSLTPPTPGSPVVYAGFPNGGQTLVPGNAKISEMDEAQSLTIRGATISGDSGSPVFDEHGLVIGIVTDGKTNLLGSIQSSLAFEALLLRLAPSSKASSLFDSILGNPIPQNFEMQFRPSASKDGATNLDLLGLMKLLNKIENLTPSQKQKVWCPLYLSAHHRFMDSPVKFITHHLPRFALPDVGRNNFKMGKIYGLLGKTDKASEIHTLAQNQLLEASQDYIARKPDPIMGIACNVSSTQQNPLPVLQTAKKLLESGGLSPNILINHRQTESPPKCDSASTDVVLSGLLRDLTLINFELAELGDEQVEQNQQAATTLAALATLLSPGSQLHAPNLALLGDVARKRGDFKFSAGAYAGAWQNGEKAKWVITNFRHSRSKLETLDIPIETYMAVNEKDLYGNLSAYIPNRLEPS